VNAFFFAPESGRSLAAVRIGIALVLLGDALVHLPHGKELYSSAGNPLPVFMGSGWIPPALSPGWTYLLVSVLLVGLLGMALGWRTRAATWLALICFTWIGLHDAAGTFKKYSVISFHLLFLLALTRPGAIWSVDRLVKPIDRMEIVPAWPRRLMGILICSVYLGAAVTKIRLPDFGTGDLVMFSLLDPAGGEATSGNGSRSIPAGWRSSRSGRFYLRCFFRCWSGFPAGDGGCCRPPRCFTSGWRFPSTWVSSRR
jgi:hypothetical protein